MLSEHHEVKIRILSGTECDELDLDHSSGTDDGGLWCMLTTTDDRVFIFKLTAADAAGQEYLDELNR